MGTSYRKHPSSIIGPIRVAYCDPPYIGQAKKHYGEEATYAGEVDHQALVGQMMSEYPDGWALSCSSPSLRTILPYCPEDIRVMAWVKPFCSFKPNVNPAYAWEPLLVHGGRAYTRNDMTVRDWLATSITLKRGLAGVKPNQFCYWLFAVLNLWPDDIFVDLFPGSGAVLRAWEQYRLLPLFAHPVEVGT